MYKYQSELWGAINEYTESCNGDTSSINVNDKRMDAVVKIEGLINKIKDYEINNYMKKIKDFLKNDGSKS